MSAPAGQPASVRYQLIELLLFLFLVLPGIWLAAALLTPQPPTFTGIMVTGMIAQVVALVAVIVLVENTGEGFRALGLRFHHLFREIGLGAAIFVPFFLGTVAVESVLRWMGVPGVEQLPDFLYPSGATQALLAVPFLVMVAVAEETVFRGYLMLRLRGLTNSRIFAVIVSSLVFSLGHGYQGLAGVITVGLMGVAFAMLYLWRNSLIVPLTVHFLHNMAALLAVPILNQV